MMANEKRLIDANAFRRRIEAFVATVRYKGIDNVPMFYETCNPTEYMRGYERGVMESCHIAVEQHTVDAVEVVRCKDCKHYANYGRVWDCKKYGGMSLPDEDDFCSYGERREGE